MPKRSSMITPAPDPTPPLPPAHWPDIARQWAQVGSPLRPVAQDVGIFSDAILAGEQNNARLRALILGVTPELYHLPWPPGTHLLAVDHTKAMIDAVWPGSRSGVVCAEWTQLPLETASRDIVLCDGGLHLLSHPLGHEELVRSLHRVIAPGGCFVIRLFVPPPQRECPDVVIDELLAGKVSNLNVLKLRLGMAIQETAAGGVQLGRVWETIHRAAPDFAALAERIGWELEHLLAINTYRNVARRYHFVTVAEVRELFCGNPGGFELERMDVPGYELGEQCPTVALRRV